MTNITMCIDLDETAITDCIRSYAEVLASDAMNDSQIKEIRITLEPRLRAHITATGKAE